MRFVAVLGFVAAVGAASGATGGPPIADVQTIALDPVNHGTIYAGVYSNSVPGGVYKSTDSGAGWTLLNADTSFSADIRVVVVDPVTPANIYAASTYSGVLKSTDGGATWNPMNTGLGSLPSAECLVIDPIAPTTLYTCIIGGIFKSTDGGASWSAANTGLSSTDVLGVTIQPGNSATLYARVNGGGVFKSTDSAGHWTAMNSGLTSLFVYSLAIDPTNPATLYTGTYNNGIFKSRDGGATWTAANTGMTGLQMGTALAIDPASPNTVYAASTASVWKTVNGGASWTPANDGLEATTNFSGGAFNTLVVDPASPSTVYLGGVLGGFYKSVDGAATWNAADNGLSTSPIVLALAVARANPANIYAGTLWGADGYLGGIYQSPNGGAGWTALSFGIKGSNQLQSMAIDLSNPSTIYAGPNVGMVGFLSGGGVVKSTDGGVTWATANNGLPTISGMANGSITTTTAGVYAIAIDPSNPGTVYCSPGTTVYKTADGGGSWTASGAGLPASTRLLSLAVDPGNDATVYAGTSVGTLYKSRDGGGTWNALNTNLPAVSIQALAISAGNSADLYAATGSSGVLVSRNSGVTWSQTGAGLPSVAVLSLAIDPIIPTTIYAGTNGDGVFKSADEGASWQATGNNTGNGTAPAAMISKVSGDAQTASAGQTLSIPQTVVVTNSSNIPVAGVTVTFTAAGGGSLSTMSVVTGVQGVASANLTLSLKAGSNTVTATAAGLGQVVFTATGTAAASSMSVTSVGNSASFTQSFAPGMLMSVFGTGLASGSPQIVTTTPLPVTSASGTSVTINGITVPLLYVSATQINFQLPYEVAPGNAVLVVNNGAQMASISFAVSAAGPGIYVDYRNGNVVPNESAAVGSTIGFYVTGAGLVTPAEATGNVPASGTTPLPNLPVTVTVGGVAVTPVYMGIPSWSVGVLQINVTVPQSLTAGYQEMVVTIGGVKSAAALLNVVQ